MNLAEPIDFAQVRIRELELSEEQMDESVEGKLDSKLPLSPEVEQIVENYTIRQTVENIVTLEEYQQRYMELAEMNDLYAKVDDIYNALHPNP